MEIRMIEAIDSLSQVRDKLKFVRIGLDQDSHEWDEEIIYGLNLILGEIQESIRESCSLLERKCS